MCPQISVILPMKMLPLRIRRMKAGKKRTLIPSKEARRNSGRRSLMSLSRSWPIAAVAIKRSDHQMITRFQVLHFRRGRPRQSLAKYEVQKLGRRIGNEWALTTDFSRPPKRQSAKDAP